LLGFGQWLTMETGNEYPLGHCMTLILEIRNLRVSYAATSGPGATALAGLNLALSAGETLGVLGESGSGKSTLAAALLGILAPNGRIAAGSVYFEGQDLLKLGSRAMQKIRGQRIALISQEPSQALHPAMRVRDQVKDVIAAHGRLRGRALRDKTRQVLAAVFPAETERISASYPHQLSGGQRTRVLIAQAIACEPTLIVADEPTASLDPETQQEVLTLFRRLKAKLDLSVIWITHNPALLADFADRMMVLYAGRLAEIGPTERVLGAPHHPYTQALLRCLPPSPDAHQGNHKTKLPVISGEAPTGILNMLGCVFEPRCAERLEVCAKRLPEVVHVGCGHEVSCFKAGG
jgi:peptide/nickel transport system ATP-binding protein